MNQIKGYSWQILAGILFILVIICQWSNVNIGEQPAGITGKGGQNSDDTGDDEQDTNYYTTDWGV